MNGLVFVIFGYAWCVAQISSATKQYETNVNEGIGYAAVNLKEGVSDSQIYSRNRRDNSKDEASYIFFDNRSDRMVELWWMDKLNGKKYKFMVLSSGETIDINSYNTHQWSVIEKYTRKSLLINKEKVFSPQPNEPSMRTILIIGRSEQTDTKIPEKFIEAMVVVDKSVIELLGSKENVTRYILTLLRMSTKVFQHQSLTKLGVKLTHVLSKLVLLHEDVNEIRFNSDDGEATFLSICSYMDKIESSGSVIFDQKIFLTKRIFGKAGYSYGKGMCRRGSNCALIFNDGFTSALNIAHETGHALGMNDRRFPQGSPFVMSGIIFARFNNYDWCRSSQISLLKNIRMKHCLDNKPSMYNKDFPFVHKYPGVHYSILKQCHLKYNMNYSTWPYQTDQCKLLTCRMPPPWTTQASGDHSHPLDGTKCGTNKWCLSGVCQKRTEPIVLPTAIHGNWGEWKAWKPCSRTCGAGISTRERECNNPLPLYGGNFCVGIAVEVRVCNTGKNCPDNPSKEDVLCSETGANTGRKRQWGIYDEAKVNLDCNFESDANAWCNWTNEIQRVQQDWKLNKGKTRSSNTGPSVDHTINTDQGQYIYFESSSPESERGYKARLSSSKLAVRQACLSFWYHMFGNREMGSLRVIQKSQGASKTLWHKTGNQGQTWLQAKVEIQDDNLYQIFFEAEKLISGYHSDIALDDITFTSGACGKAGLQISTTTDTRDQCSVRCTTIDNKRPQKILLDVPVYDGTRCHDKGSAGICYRGKCMKVGCDGVIDSSKKFDNCDVCGGDGSSCKSNVILEDKRQEKSASDLGCDFNNDLCQWNNVKNNASDLGWSRKKEKSYNQGHYLYLETSSSQRKGKFKAKIVSPEVGTSKACLSFDYKMNVNKLGKLKVKLLTKSRQFASLRWFKKGSQGNMWRKAKIYIKKNVPYKVVLEAIVKNQQHGNVAIDNVQFLRQNC